MMTGFRKEQKWQFLYIKTCSYLSLLQLMYLYLYINLCQESSSTVNTSSSETTICCYDVLIHGQVGSPLCLESAFTDTRMLGYWWRWSSQVSFEWCSDTWDDMKRKQWLQMVLINLTTCGFSKKINETCDWQQVSLLICRELM